MVKIYTILSELGLNSKDIRQRLANGQLKLNGKTIKDLNKELNIEYGEPNDVQDYGDWIGKYDLEFVTRLSRLRFFFDSFGDMFRLKTNIKSKELRSLKAFLCLQTDKKTVYILSKKKKL
jgi:hypothetical protein